MVVSSRIEDYMETIFSLEVSGKEATVTDVAAALGVAKATVVSAMKRLVAASMATQERYGALQLTEQGRELALRIHRRHEHLTFLFKDVLGFEAERAKAMACALEHEMDEKAERRILGFVEYLVRAHREGEAWVRDLLSVMGDDRRLPRPLSMIPLGEEGVVSRVTAEEPLREALFDKGFAPGAEVVLRRRNPDDNTFSVSVQGDGAVLKGIEAASVWVCPAEDD